MRKDIIGLIGLVAIAIVLVVSLQPQDQPQPKEMTPRECPQGMHLTQNTCLVNF